MFRLNPTLCVFICLLGGCGRAPYQSIHDLDEALRSKESYDQIFQGHIALITSAYINKNDPSQVYHLNKQLAEEYSPYSLDSTTRYLNLNLKIAESLSDRVMIVETDLALASEYCRAGYYLEASEILRHYSSDSVPDDLKQDYYSVCHSLSGEMMAFTSSVSVRIEQLAARDNYRDSLLAIVQPQSFQWCDLKREAAEQAHNTEEAKHYAWMMVQMSVEDSRDYAKACYFYQSYLSDQDGAPDRIKWLSKSAIADVKRATKDYAAMNSLGGLLFQNGDVERSFRYLADYCMPDALAFGGKLRPWQISLVFPEIERVYSERRHSQEQATRLMVTLIVIALLLMMLMLYNIVKRQKDLVRMNNKLQAVNSKFLEANKVKQEYIALFLGRLSENISTTRKYRNHVLKYLRRGNDKYLIDEIESQPPMDEDIQQFNKMFDETFVNLYPGFVEQFNKLLADGEKITPKEGEILSPELRIFALIKLGISDSSKIASLLHYSANTIYNYRSKIKNKAKGDRDKFESYVRDIE